MRILIVDDNPEDRLLAKRGIERAVPGAEIREAGTAPELGEALAAGAPDVAVLDFDLGWANGLEVFRRLRAAYPDCGAVVFSGSLGEEGAVAVMREGVDDYIVKDPSRVPRLAATVEGLARRVGDRRELRREAARNAAMRRSGTVGMVTCAPDGNVLAANPAARRMLGLGEGPVPLAANLLETCSAPGLAERWTAPGGTEVGALEVTFGEGRVALLEAHAAPEADGQVECVLTEVTDLKAAERRSRMLLREVYHRVYNNLQVIDALLGMHGARQADPSAREAFKDVSRQLRALALIQQCLHRGDDLGSVDFGAYLRDLAHTLSQAMARPGVSVEARGDEGLRVPIDTAVPLGLLATELVTNALKHAFPGGRTGRVTAAIARSAGGSATLVVEDDGIGLPEGTYGGRKGGTGSAVVPALAGQVGAKLSVAGGPGTRLTLDLPPEALTGR